MNKTLKEILEMNVESDEFFSAYKAISDKYWTFESPDDFQLAAKNIVMVAESFDEDKVVLCHKVMEQIIQMTLDKTKACTGHLVFKDCEYYFDISENEVEKDKMKNLIGLTYKAVKEKDFFKND